MQKPEVRIIEPQQEETRVVDASQSERDYLLAKYGYKEMSEPEPQYQSHPSQHLTFEEMIAIEERKEMEKRRREMERREREGDKREKQEWETRMAPARAKPRMRQHRSPLQDPKS